MYVNKRLERQMKGAAGDKQSQNQQECRSDSRLMDTVLLKSAGHR